MSAKGPTDPTLSLWFKYSVSVAAFGCPPVARELRRMSSDRSMSIPVARRGAFSHAHSGCDASIRTPVTQRLSVEYVPTVAPAVPGGDVASGLSTKRRTTYAVAE